jgi:predicted enzyme related to lactoylglutathione lyase
LGKSSSIFQAIEGPHADAYTYKMEFLGLRTLIYPTQNIDASKKWWQDFFGFAPYYDEPYYVGFQVGGYEVGLNPGADMALGPVTYMGVDSIAEGLVRAEAHGCTVVSGIEDVGEGIAITHLLSPTGERFGLIVNPHFSVDRTK